MKNHQNIADRFGIPTITELADSTRITKFQRAVALAVPLVCVVS